MKSALAVRFVAFEDLGTLAGILPRHDYAIRYLETGLEPVDARAIETADLVVLLGGPISANDTGVYPFLDELQTAIAERLLADRPTLGLCLGAQIMARALDASIYPAGSKEIGWARLEVGEAGQRSCLRHLADTPVLHWHGESFDLPAATAHLAATPACRNQAFSLGPNILGLQFHPEVTAENLERWYVGHTLELEQAGIDIMSLRAESQRYAPALSQKATACFDEWLQSLTA